MSDFATEDAFVKFSELHIEMSSSSEESAITDTDSFYEEEEQVLMDSTETKNPGGTIPCASPLLQLFWDLASLDASERVDAAQKLIDGLYPLQKQFIKDHSEDIKAKYQFEIDPESLELATVDVTAERRFHLDNPEDAETEEISDLDVLCHSDVAYALNRLSKGLASSRQGARQGFATALCELLKTVIPFLPPFLAISLVRQFSELSGNMKGFEERDMIFGRVFGYTAIVRAGSMQGQLVAANDFKIMIADLTLFAKKKPYVRECSFNLVHMLLKQLPTPELKQEIWRHMASTELGVLRTANEICELMPETLGLLCEMQNCGADIDMSTVCNLPNAMKVYSPRNYEKIAEIMRDSTEFVHPRIHSSWNILIGNLISSGSELDFKEFWTVVIDGALFSGSIEKKHLGLKLFETFMPQVVENGYQMIVIMTPNLCKCLLNSIENADVGLHKLSKRIIELLREVAKEDRKFSLQVAACLSGMKLGSASSGPIVQKHISSRQIVDEFLSNGVEESDKSNMLSEYVKLFCDPPVKTSLDNDRAIDSYRHLCVDQICSLSKAAKLNGDISTLDSALQVLFLIAYYDICSDFRVLGVVFKLSGLISDETRKYVVTKFWAMLSEAVGNLKTCVANDNALVKVMKFCRSLECDRDFELISGGGNADAKVVLKKAYDIVRQSNEENHQQFLVLISLTSLQTMLASDDEKEELTNILEELIQCFGHMEKLSSDSTLELNPVDVLTDVFISILAHQPNSANEYSCIGLTTKLWRILVDAVFKQYCSKLSLTGLDAMLQVLDPWQNSTDENEESEIDEDSDGKDHGHGHHHEHSSSDGESEHDEEIDEDLQAKIQAAFANGESMVDSDEDLNDEQMITMGFDDKLAEIFRERHLEKKQKTETVKNVVEFRFKVLDLIDVYVKSVSQEYSVACLPLMTNMVLSLVKSAAIHSNPAGAISVVQKMKTSPENPVDIESLMVHLNGVTELSHDVRNQISTRMLGIVKKICKINAKACLLDPKKKEDVAIVETLWNTIDSLESIMKGADYELIGLLSLISVPGKESVQACIDVMIWLLKSILFLTSKTSPKKTQKCIEHMKTRFKSYLDCSLVSKRSVPATIFTNFMQKHVLSAVSTEINPKFDSAKTAWEILGEPISTALMVAVDSQDESKKISKYQMAQMWHTLEAFLKHLEVSEKCKEWWQTVVMKQFLKLIASTLQFFAATMENEDRIKSVRVKEILLIVHEIIRKNGKIMGTKQIQQPDIVKLVEQVSTSIYADETPAIKQISAQMLSDILNMKRSATAPAENTSKKQKKNK